MRHIVIDCESLSTAPNAFIASIGAAVVDDEAMMVMPDAFDVAIDVTTVDQDHFDIDPATVLWWLRQPQQAREALCGGTDTLFDALQSLIAFIDGHRSVSPEGIKVYGNGPHFDMTIIENAFEVCGMTVPWQFHEVRCVRTICEQWGVRWKDYLNPDEAHDATFDAVAEAKGVLECLKRKKFHERGPVPWAAVTASDPMQSTASQTIADREADALAAPAVDAQAAPPFNVDWAAMAAGAADQEPTRFAEPDEAVSDDKRAALDAIATARASVGEMFEACNASMKSSQEAVFESFFGSYEAAVVGK